jgi:hypothetical protein
MEWAGDKHLAPFWHWNWHGHFREGNYLPELEAVVDIP